MKEDKVEELLKAMEHPENYTDEELQELLNDEELRDLYELAVKAEQGFMRRRVRSQRKPAYHMWWRVAAAFAVFIMLSGLTIAAIHAVRGTDREMPQEAREAVVVSQHPSPDAGLPSDTLRTFQDAELQEILKEMADFYHLRVLYQTEQARHTRLYIKWNKRQNAHTMIDRLNGFEKVNVRLDNDLIIAE